MDIGRKLRQLRIKINLTQEELADRCDLSKGFISQIERNLTSPSIATLIDILDSLGTNLNGFFNEIEDEQIVFRKDDIIIQEEDDYTISWLVPNAQKNSMEPILLKIRENSSSEKYYPYEGEFFAYVLKGKIEFYFNDKKENVKKGETIYFKADSHFYVKNTSKSEAILILVSNPPNF